LHKNLKIQDFRVLAYKIPTSFPEADGTLEWQETVIVIVEARSGPHIGIGYTYADVACAKLACGLLRKNVLNENPLNIVSIWENLVRNVRNLGRSGLASMAISAIDNCLWDLKCKILGLPLCELLGQVRPSISVYGSGGFTSYNRDQLRTQLQDWLKLGI